MPRSIINKKIDTNSEFFERELPLLSNEVPDNPREIMQRIMAYRKELGIDFLEKDDIKLEQRRSPNGLIIRLGQTYHGIPMVDREIIARLHGGRLTYFSVNVGKPRMKQYPPGVGTITPSKAEEIAISALSGINGNWAVYDNHKVFLRIGDFDVLAYAVRVHSEEPIGSWNVLLEARGGRIIRRYNLLRFLDTKARLISPNPIVIARNADLRTIMGAYNEYAGTYCTPPIDYQTSQDFERLKSEVDLKDVQSFGQNIVLKGPFADVLIHNTLVYPSSLFSATYPANTILDFPIFDNQGGIDYECVMAYYLIDLFQRYLQNSLGYENLHNRLIIVQIETGSNPPYMACYDPLPKKIYFFRKYWKCWNDAAEDGDVILHEYIHAIFEDLEPKDTYFESEYYAIEEGTATFVPCIFFAADHPFNYSLWADWMYADSLPRTTDLTTRQETYAYWLSQRPVVPMSSNVTQDQYEASIRAWRYEGGFIFASFLLLSYDAACNGSPNHSLTKDFLAALLQSIELQGGGDTLEDCTELFMSHIVMKDVELQSIQRMLKVIDDKQIMQFKISYLGIRKPRIGDWRDPRTIIGEMEGIPPTQTEYRLTDGVTHDIWLKSTQKELIICIRLSNKKLVGPLPYQGGDARLFAVQVDFDVMIAGNPSRLILPRPARRMQANLQLSRNRTVSFALPIDVLRDIGDKEFRVVVSLVTPYSVHEIASDWHESPLTVLSNLHYI